MERKSKIVIAFACTFVLLSLFGALSSEIFEKEGFAFDAPIMWFLHAQATDGADRAMVMLSYLGSYRVLVPVVLVVLLGLLWARRPQAALFWVTANLGTLVLNLGAKPFFGRARPTLWASMAPETSLSFPSGHAMSSMALSAAIVVLLWRSRWRWPAVAVTAGFTVLVGLSRIYLGVHFPSDVLAGWTASLAWVLLLALAINGPRSNHSRKIV